MAVRDRVREAFFRVFLVLEDATDNLEIERSVREIHPGRKRVVGNVGGGWLSQRPLVAVNKLRPIRKAVVRDDSPFLQTGTVLANIEGVDANLGLEESLVVVERESSSCCTRQGQSEKGWASTRPRR